MSDAVATGPAEAVETCFRRDRGPLLALARLLGGQGPDDAEEVLQEATVRTLVAWERAGRVDDPGHYLRTAVVNLRRDGWRRTARRGPALPMTDGPDGSDVAADLEADEQQRRLVTAVRDLPPRQREVVALRYLHECSTQEAATTLGISEGTVKTHLHRALEALAGALEDLR